MVKWSLIDKSAAKKLQLAYLELVKDEFQKKFLLIVSACKQPLFLRKFQDYRIDSFFLPNPKIIKQKNKAGFPFGKTSFIRFA